MENELLSRQAQTEQHIRTVLLKERLKFVLPIGLLSVFILAAALWRYIWTPLSIARDLKGAVNQTAMGVVASTYIGKNGPDTVYVRVLGETLPVEIAPVVHVSQHIKINYCIGASGKIYVSRIEPTAP